MLSLNSNGDGESSTFVPTSVNPEDLTVQNNNEVHHKKKKKRHRGEDGEAPQGDVTHKKKRKNRHAEQQPDGTVPAEIAGVTVSGEERPPKKHKKPKKSKNKDVSPDSEVTQVDPNVQAAALLSAIVAAAAGTPDVLASAHQPQMPPPPPFHPHMMSPFMPFPSMPYDFPPPYADGSHPPPPLFPPPMGLPLSELTFGSNEDVLRALQDLDMSKITSVLKSLGDTGQVNGPPYGLPPPSFIAPLPEQPQMTRMGQVPTASNAILGVPPKNPAAPVHHRRTLDMSLTDHEQHSNPNHTDLLARKWLSAGKLAELVRTEGLVYKKGKFSAIEEQQLKAAIENFKIDHCLSEEQLQDVIFPKNEKSRNNAFWTELTLAVPLRPIIAVYHHIRRAYHHIQPKGPWTPDEDVLLKQAVTDLGQRWERVSERVGRRSADCRDRYRNHIQGREKRIMGQWSKEEEEKLIHIVTEMTIKQGKDIDNDVFWGKVSQLMDGTRGRQQCRIKWTDALSKTVKNEGQKPRWGQQDAFILIHKIDSLSVRDDTEINWKALPDPDWNLWSAHTLQRRWLTMKRSIKGFEDMTHQEIMDILRVKKAHLPAIAPPPQLKKRKERKVTSAEAVSEPTEGNPGSSTNPVAREVEMSSSDDSSSDSSSGSESD